MSIENQYIKDIIAPLLDDVNYADSIKSCFNNINQNFKILANHDFIKGNTGDSIIIKEIDLNLPENVGWLLDIENVILNDLIGGESPETSLAAKIINFGTDNDPINIGPFDELSNYKLYLIYSNKNLNNDNSKIVSSLNFVFLDARFNRDLSKLAMTTVGKPNPDNVKLIDAIANAQDLSCIINWDPNKNRLVALQSFPVLYYDELLGLCWKNNNTKTGIPAQGPRGVDGEPGRLFLIKIDKTEPYPGKPDWYKIKYILNDSGEFVDPYDPETDKNLIKFFNQLDGSVALALPNNDQISPETPDFWVSVIDKIDDTYYANCGSYNSIKIVLSSNEFLEALKNIDWQENIIKGLFIPRNPGNKKNGEAHTIYANNLDAEGNYTDLNIGLTNINDGTELPIANNSKLNIKYENVNINGSVAEGYRTTASGGDSHAEGANAIASGYGSHAEGGGTKAIGKYSHTEGCSFEDNLVEASGTGSHAEGICTTASGTGSHAEGGDEDTISGDLILGGTASGNGSHAEGIETTASGDASHVEGYGGPIPDEIKIKISNHALTANELYNSGENAKFNLAYDKGSHAEGEGTYAYGRGAHAEGGTDDVGGTYALGDYSHAEGYSTTAEGEYSHAEGQYTTASGAGSHAEGFHTIVSSDFAHVEGTNNVDTPNAIHMVGVGHGVSSSNSKNAHTITNDGKHYILNAGGYDGTQTNFKDIDDLATILNRNKRYKTIILSPTNNPLTLGDNEKLIIAVPGSYTINLPAITTISFDNSAEIIYLIKPAGTDLTIFNGKHIGSGEFNPIKFSNDYSALIIAFKNPGTGRWDVMRFQDPQKASGDKK